MKSKNKYSGINPAIVKKVRGYAKYMKSLKCFVHDDLEDIEQELFCEIWPCIQQYKESKSSISYFTGKVVKRRVINLINKKQRMKYGGNILFLDNETLDSLVDENCNFEDEIVTCLDVEDAIKQLPPHWQDLCRKLKVYNIAEVSEMTGLSRTTIYKILKRIDKKFPHLKTYIS